MSASLIRKTQDTLTIQIEIPLRKSMLEGGREKLTAAMTYFKNNDEEERMNYAEHIKKNHFYWLWCY